jgi:CubicO group peptidase (beta-lactamase class C family)
MTSKLEIDLAEQHADLATALSLLDKWIALQIHQRHLPGLAVGIVHDGNLIWGKGYGMANVEQSTPITLDTRFRIASITKTFTATAIMQLRDAGKLRLDDPVSEYLDWFNLRYEDAPPITIRHLLTHTSGLPRDASIPHWTDNVFQSWDEVITTTQQRKPVIPPLKDFGYSNLGYSLLGGIIETVSGEAWADYIQQHILNHLGMMDTIVTPTGREPNLATGYLKLDDQYARKSAPFAATNGFSASASMASSVNDLVKYARFHLGLQGSEVLSLHTLREMHAVHWLNKDWKGGYGLGTFVECIGDWTISGHSGGYKGYLTQFNLCREHNFGVIALTNSFGSDPLQFVERTYKLVLPEVLKATAPKTPEAKSEWAKFVGTYAADWGNSEVVVRGGQLQLISVLFIDELPVILEPTDQPNVFTLKDPGNPPETARFELDSAGSVSRLWLRNEYMLPKRS